MGLYTCVTTSFFDTAQTGYWGSPGPYDFTYDADCIPGQLVDTDPVVAPAPPAPPAAPPYVPPYDPPPVMVITPAPPVSAVPEPSSAVLMGIVFGVVILVWTWRKYRLPNGWR